MNGRKRRKRREQREKERKRKQDIEHAQKARMPLRIGLVKMARDLFYSLRYRSLLKKLKVAFSRHFKIIAEFSYRESHKFYHVGAVGRSLGSETNIIRWKWYDLDNVIMSWFTVNWNFNLSALATGETHPAVQVPSS